MLELLLELLKSKMLSVPSFGRYWKQPIGRPYWIYLEWLLLGVGVKLLVSNSNAKCLTKFRTTPRLLCKDWALGGGVLTGDAAIIFGVAASKGGNSKWSAADSTMQLTSWELPGDNTLTECWTALRTRLSRANIQWGLILWRRRTELTASWNQLSRTLMFNCSKQYDVQIASTL